MERQELQVLVDNYASDRAAIAERFKDLTLLITLGASGTGKTTLMRASGFPMIVGDASRSPRPGEINGVDYNFRTEEAMIEDVRNGRYVQIAMGPGGDLKGTKVDSFPEHGIAAFAVVASALHAFRALPFAHTETAVIIPTNFATWMSRIEAQHSDPAQLPGRLAEARESLTFALQDSLAQFVLNDTIELGVQRLQQVARGIVPDQAEEAHLAATTILTELLNIMH